MKKENWIWMPHAAHFVCGQWCRFTLATYVGGYVVSTVGEYFPDEGVREIIASSRGITLEGKGDARSFDYMKKIGFEELGFDRKYETMVFKSMKNTQKDKGCGCPYVIESGSNLDFEGYNKPEDALKGHMKFCNKWSKKA